MKTVKRLFAGGNAGNEQLTAAVATDLLPLLAIEGATLLRLSSLLTVHAFVGLRNPFFAQVQGTVGRVMQVDGKTVDVIAPAQASHTFAIPQLGVYVPLAGVADNAKTSAGRRPAR